MVLLQAAKQRNQLHSLLELWHKKMQIVDTQFIAYLLLQISNFRFLLKIPPLSVG